MERKTCIVLTPIALKSSQMINTMHITNENDNTFDAPMVGKIYLFRFVLPQCLPVSEKNVKIISLQKGFPNLAYTLSGTIF